jgi:integrase
VAGLGSATRVDLRSRLDGRGGFHVGAKTDAGRRSVKIRGALGGELVVRARHQEAEQSARAFPPDVAASRALTASVHGSSVARRSTDGEEIAGSGAIALANRHLEADGLPTLPARLTPHSPRRTFCSLLYALARTPGTVRDEMGRTDSALALRAYRQAMRRHEDEKAALRAMWTL